MADLIVEYTAELGTGCSPDSDNLAISFWYSALGMWFDRVSVSRGHKTYQLEEEGGPGIDAVVDYDNYSIQASYRDIAENPPTDEVPTGTGKQIPIIRSMYSQSIEGIKTTFIGLNERLLRYRESDGILDVSQSSGGPYMGSWAEETLWQFDSWGSWVTATNGQDYPQIYKGSTFIDIEGFKDYGSGFAEILIVRNPFAIAMNLEDDPTGIIWCDDDDIEGSWLSTQQNLAGYLNARGMNSPIRAATKWNKEIAFFGDDEMRSLDFIGTPLVFGINPRVLGIGANGKRSVCYANGLLYGSGPSGIWRSDGFSKDYIDTAKVKRYVEARYDKSQRWKCHTFDDPSASTVWFYFPSLTSMFGVGFNYKSETWQLESAPLTASVSAGVYEFSLCSADGQLAFQSNLTTHEFTTVARRLNYATGAASKTLDLGNSDLKKFVSEIEIELVISGTDATPETVFAPKGNLSDVPDALAFSLGWKIEDDDAWTFIGPTLFKQNGVLKSRFPVGRDGRFWCLKLLEDDNTSTTNYQWEIHKVRFYGEVLGATR